MAVRPLDGALYEAWATWNTAALSGSVGFQQTDTGASTIIVALDNVPAGLPLSLTVLTEATSVGGGACPAAATVFDPTGVAAAGTLTCAGLPTLSGCTAGDLVGKFGALPAAAAGGSGAHAVFTDPTLSVQGRASVVGHTLRVAWAGGQACAPVLVPAMTATFFNGTTSLTDSNGLVTTRSVGGGVSVVAVPGAGVQVAVTVREGLSPGAAYSINLERTSAGTTATACPAVADIYDPLAYVFARPPPGGEGGGEPGAREKGARGPRHVC